MLSGRAWPGCTLPAGHACEWHVDGSGRLWHEAGNFQALGLYRDHHPTTLLFTNEPPGTWVEVDVLMAAPVIALRMRGPGLRGAARAPTTAAAWPMSPSS